MQAKPPSSFDIDRVMQRLREAVKPFAPAALFGLADEGYSSPFAILIACLISTRTRDEVTVVCARRLLTQAPTPAAMSQMTPAAIDALISDCTFHEVKARQMVEIASRLVNDYDGVLPCDDDVIQSFRGIGPKCANLVLGIACQQPRISVDIHVHRITNRWGYVQARTPEATMLALEAVLPPSYWIEINRLLVPFGKHVCTGSRPRCSTCPVREMCQQRGVDAHR
jgi:endonuclease-3